MKKKIISLMLCMLLAVTLLSGCSLFETDKNAYYTQVVGRIGDVEVTKEELLEVYNANIETFVNSYGYTAEAATKLFIDYLLEEKLLLQKIDKLIQEEIDNNVAQSDYQYALTNNEYNEAVQKVWDTIDSDLSSIAENYFDIEDIFSEEDKGEQGTTKTIFEPTVEVVNGVVKRLDAKDEKQAEKLDVKNYKQPVYQETTDKKIWSKFISVLKKNEEGRLDENGKKLSTNDKDVFNRYLDKLLTKELNNAKIAKFEETYEKNYGFDSNGNLTPATTQEVLDYYSNIYKANQEIYDNIDSDHSKYFNAMTSSTDRSKIFYNAVLGEFYEVTHILIPITEGQKAEVTEIENDPYLTQEEKDIAIANEKSIENTTVTQKIDGYETDVTKSVKQIYDEIMSKWDDLYKEYSSNTQLFASKVAEMFDPYIYMYSTDTGSYNLDFSYVVGKTQSGMVEEFTDACRELFDMGQGYISEPVLSEHGYHIILYTRPVENLVNDANDITIEILNENYTSLQSGKTYLEYILSQVRVSNYSEYKTLLLTELKNGEPIEYIKKAIKDLY